MWSKFGHPVVFSPGFHRQEFTLLVSFIRASFKLDVHTIGTALHASFGSYAQGFRVRHLKDRTFKFCVLSNSVGFEIYNAGRISEKDFDMVFNLWGHGGPNWHHEERLFYAEEEKE